MPQLKVHTSSLNGRRRCAADSGFALPSAILVLFVLAMLAGTSIAVSSHTSSSTTRDSNTKAALEAAEAGLQVASYRLSQIKPAETQCINEKEAVTSNCNDNSESLGNGATYKYWTTLPLKVGEKCAGKEVLKVESGTTFRCVTSEGQVNSITPGTRLQTLIEAKIGESLFPVKGIIGLEEIKLTGSVKIPAVVASNGKIIGEGSANFERGFELCPPKGTFTPAAGSERKRSGVKIAGKNPESDPPLEVTRKEGAPECPLAGKVPTNHATEAINDDALIGTTDKLEGSYTWNAAAHEMTIEGIGKLTFAASGKYYFCNFKMPGGEPKLIVAPTAKVEIFIDSPEDKESKCAAGTGKFEMAGGSKAENEAKNPAALLIELYGKGPFSFSNGSSKTLEAAVYAPNAEVSMEGGVKFKGGVVGNIVHVENGTSYEWNEEVASLTNGSGGGYARKAWEQCTPGSGASEGC